MSSQLRNFKLTIEYDGTDFNGWQIQTKKQRTVQGEIEAALKRIFKKRIRLHGSGRTDSGVHAIGQVANFKAETGKPLEEIQFALNAHLPKDISVVDIKQVAISFNAQYSAKSKTYRYTILNRKIRSPRLRNFAFFYPHALNLARMRRAAGHLVGKHDFKAFTSLESARIKEGKARGTIRTIKRLSIRKSGSLIQIEIQADGFLYRMVRNMVGLLLLIGRGSLRGGTVRRILTEGNAPTAKAAPPQGLCLLEVKYH